MGKEKPKHTRRSRKTLRRQVDDCLFQIDRELEAGTERPARLTLLKAKLETLTILLRREDAQKERDATRSDAANPKVTTEKPTANSVEEIEEILAKAKAEREKKELDAKVAQIMSRMNSQPPAKPVPRPVISSPGVDPDLLV
jgi:hypothetical protein